MRPSVQAKVYDEEAYNTPIEVLTRGSERRAPIRSYGLDDTFGVYLVVFKADEFRAPTREEHEFCLQKALGSEKTTADRRAARKAGELDDSDGSDSDSEDDDC